MYTAPEAKKELRDLKEMDERDDEVEKGKAGLRCLKEAVKMVKETRQMEGVLEVQGTGRVGFLVYRVD